MRKKLLTKGEIEFILKVEESWQYDFDDDTSFDNITVQRMILLFSI